MGWKIFRIICWGGVEFCLSSKSKLLSRDLDVLLGIMCCLFLNFF